MADMSHTMFAPHGMCMMWNQNLIWLHVVTDALVAMAYYSIPAALFLLAKKRPNSLPFRPLLILFGLFIAFCGAGHIMDIVSIWEPIYWTKGFWNAGTALTSVVTAFVLIPKAAEFLKIPEETARLQGEKRMLEERHSLLRSVLDSVSEGILLTDPSGRPVTYNAAASNLLGSTLAVEWGGHAAQDHRILESTTGRVMEQTTKPLPGVGQLYVLRDITEQKRQEREQADFQKKLLQSQKLESLGVLAGGVAHDFNNLLTGILGHASLVMESLDADNPLSEDMRQVIRAGERAGDLTRQLLAYSGKGRFLVQPIDLSGLAEETKSLVQLSIPKWVELRFHLTSGLPTVEADSTQLQQLLMNLVINAAEAIGEDYGTVDVSTGREYLETAALEAGFASQGLQAGEYVYVQVRDNGCGMDEATKAQIFDPFFTTKFTGRGLGLAAALGIVRGHNGSMRVESEPGQGTTFKVYLPALSGRAPSASGTLAVNDLRGMGTVLVVDDESAVRSAAQSALQYFGYSVVLTENGHLGVEAFEKSPGDFVAVLLDLTMPVMGGEEALKRLHRVRAGVPVVLTSGFTESEAVRRFAGKNLAGFLQKPFTSRQLARAVQDAISGSALGAG